MSKIPGKDAIASVAISPRTNEMAALLPTLEPDDFLFFNIAFQIPCGEISLIERPNRPPEHKTGAAASIVISMDLNSNYSN